MIEGGEIAEALIDATVEIVGSIGDGDGGGNKKKKKKNRRAKLIIALGIVVLLTIYFLLK